MLTYAMKMVIRIGVEVDLLYFILFRLLLRHMAASHQISYGSTVNAGPESGSSACWRGIIIS